MGKEINMKKALVYTILVLTLGCVISYVIKPVQNDNPAAIVITELLLPTIAYADSDTVYAPKPPPPPIP